MYCLRHLEPEKRWSQRWIDNSIHLMASCTAPSDLYGGKNGVFPQVWNPHLIGYSSLTFCRCEQAKRHPELFLSLVTDGMAQSHCVLPWQKNLATAVKPTLNQHIQGVIIHGHKTIFYRTFHTINNTASLQIHTFLLSLQNIRAKTGVLPETLYYQIDGGSENTAKAVYYLCELIVARRLVKCIKLCRLLVGHTHCDVDATFAHAWAFFRVSLVI